MHLADQFTFQQNPQMLGNCLPAYVEIFGNGIGSHSVYGNECYDCSSGRVCYGLKNISSHFNNYYETIRLPICKLPFSFANFFFKIFILYRKNPRNVHDGKEKSEFGDFHPCSRSLGCFDPFF